MNSETWLIHLRRDLNINSVRSPVSFNVYTAHLRIKCLNFCSANNSLSVGLLIHSLVQLNVEHKHRSEEKLEYILREQACYLIELPTDARVWNIYTGCPTGGDSTCVKMCREERIKLFRSQENRVWIYLNLANLRHERKKTRQRKKIILKGGAILNNWKT